MLDAFRTSLTQMGTYAIYANQNNDSRKIAALKQFRFLFLKKKMQIDSENNDNYKFTPSREFLVGKFGMKFYFYENEPKLFLMTWHFWKTLSMTM